MGLVQMLKDAQEGKFDIIVVKNLSRLSRNLMDCMRIIYMLRALPKPVGILFETENMFTLDIVRKAKPDTPKTLSWVKASQDTYNNTITKIVTNIDGFESVANRITPNSGHLEQTDAEARSSYIDRLANRALGTVASIVSILYSDVEGVTYATGYQNDTDETDADGRPPHSIEIVVQGGSDAAVANVIWKNKAAGIRAVWYKADFDLELNGHTLECASADEFASG